MACDNKSGWRTTTQQPTNKGRSKGGQRVAVRPPEGNGLWLVSKVADDKSIDGPMMHDSMQQQTTKAGGRQQRNNQATSGAAKVGNSSRRDRMKAAVDNWWAAAEQQKLLLLLLHWH